RRHTRCLSDWSSDVCSSDLSSWTPGGLNPGPETSADAETSLLSSRRMSRALGSRLSSLKPRYRLRSTHLNPRAQPPPDMRSPFEIGRASCRERVYVQGSYA